MQLPTHEEAARLLGLHPGARPVEVKRAYRRKAREHHPDLGGDPHRFQQLQLAYERLALPTGAPPPRVARGRPSRPGTGADVEPDEVDIAGVDRGPWPEAGRTRLTAAGFSRWLASEAPTPVHPLQATSRSPRSRLNRVAHLLASELTATLAVRPTTDDLDADVVEVEVVGLARRSRRALDGVDLAGVWVRRRTSSTTRLRSTLRPSPDRRATALLVTRRVTALLERLDWPLEQWRLQG